MVSVQGQLPLAEGTAGDPDLSARFAIARISPWRIPHVAEYQRCGRVQDAAGIPFLQRLPEVATTLKALAVTPSADAGASPFRG